METLGAVAGCWGMPQGMVHVNDVHRRKFSCPEVVRQLLSVSVKKTRENWRNCLRLKVPKSGESGRNTWRYLEILGDTWRLVDVHRPESPRVASFHYLPFLSNLFESCDKFRALGVAKISYSFCCTANDYKWQSNLIHKYPTISIEYQ